MREDGYEEHVLILENMRDVKWYEEHSEYKGQTGLERWYSRPRKQNRVVEW